MQPKQAVALLVKRRQEPFSMRIKQQTEELVGALVTRFRQPLLQSGQRGVHALLSKTE